MVPEEFENVPGETRRREVDVGDETGERKERVFSNVFGVDERDVSGAVEVICKSLLRVLDGLGSILGRDFREAREFG